MSEPSIHHWNTESDRRAQEGESEAEGYSPELSPEARAALAAGLRSAETEPFQYLGSFAQYADDE